MTPYSGEEALGKRRCFDALNEEEMVAITRYMECNMNGTSLHNDFRNSRLTQSGKHHYLPDNSPVRRAIQSRCVDFVSLSSGTVSHQGYPGTD